jgi:hypothetical protein
LLTEVIADANLTARISGAITDGKYTDALIALAEMRIRGEAPKLGALCRWVRDLDVISGVNLHGDDITKPQVAKDHSNVERIRVVDSILRVTGPTDSNIEPSDLLAAGPIFQKPTWNLQKADESRLPTRQSVLDGSIFRDQDQALYRNFFRILETTPGPQRKPPNLHPAILYLTSPSTIPLSPTPPTITHEKHPHVPNLSLMLNVFTPQECHAIVAATETIGFLPDAPITDAGGAGSSILAHNVYWLTDTAFHDALWSRVEPFIPPHADGRRARSVNRRFRVYRYVPGAEYRAHIDGAWPPSGVSPSGTYLYDSSPPSQKQSSLLTFLIYLNDEFEGGETTFFVPSVKEGTLNAYPVKPVMGAVAMFPHGEARGALLHEGTGVRKGAKYIIRTDVEFDVEVGRE